MEKHEAYSVLIMDDKGRRGTGTLFYSEGLSSFYVLTCAHVIYTSEKVWIRILIPTAGDPEEKVVTATKAQFHFSPIDEPTVIGDQSIHTCDIAIVECELGDLFLRATRYSFYPMTNRERVRALGYSQGDGPFLNAADREAELKGFSGSPVWDEAMLEEHQYLFGGLIAAGIGTNISRGRIKVMNARYVQSLMYQEFGILMENRIPNVSENEVAPGYEEPIETPDQAAIRDSWIEHERCKGQTYVDGLQLQKAIDVTRKTIENTEFRKCTVEQKYSIYAVLLEAYRLAREFEIYDRISEEMHRAGISSEREETILFWSLWQCFIICMLFATPILRRERIALIRFRSIRMRLIRAGMHFFVCWRQPTRCG